MEFSVSLYNWMQGCSEAGEEKPGHKWKDCDREVGSLLRTGTVEADGMDVIALVAFCSKRV